MDNLKAEMQRNGLTVKDIMSTIGCSEKTARNKINGETDFTYPEAEKVRNVLFPGLRMEYLFCQRRTQPTDPKKSAWKSPGGEPGTERWKEGEEVSVQLVIAAWLIDLATVWIAKRWLGGEIQGYILFSIMLSYLCAVLTLYEWVVHL